MPATENEAFKDEEETEINHRRNAGNKKGFPPSYDDFEPANDKWTDKSAPVEGVTLENAGNQKQSFKEIWAEYPKSVGFIVGNEFCERFSYYGMRAVLTLYLVNVLQYNNNQATALYSGFVMLCYFSPVLGATLADGYIGKFHTILWVSLFYAAGNVTIAVAASFPNHSVVHPWLDFIGLAMIGLGTGGIKPCVQSFGGDQFRKGQEKQLQQFFSIFYFAINAGSTISILITPIFRTLPCQGRPTCYPLAFGVPAALMVIAVVFFVVGTYWYKKVPPEGNVIARVGKTMGSAISNKHTFDIKRDHWLDHALDSHSCSADEECRGKAVCEKAQFVKDIQALLRVLVVYVPVPIFWALYEQQGSTWVIQGCQMNVEIAPNVFFLPDQMGVLNAVLIMALIPIFQFGIYPLAAKCFKVTPLRKMSLGGLVAVVAYIICMLVQISIRETLPKIPGSHQTLLTVNNYVQACPYGINFTAMDGSNALGSAYIERNKTHMFTFNSPNKPITWKIEPASNDHPCKWVTDNQKHFADNSTMTLIPGFAGYTIFTDDETNLWLHKMVTQKSTAGEAVFVINVNNYANKTWVHAANGTAIALCKGQNTWPCDTKDSEKYKEFLIDSTQTSDYQEIKPGTWGVFVPDSDTTKKYVGDINKKENGGIYSLTVFSADNKVGASIELAQQAPDNTVSILWQVPQYFVISVAEILFSITGNEFAYSQAPLSMKAVVMALWLLTDSIGNVIILLIASVSTTGFDMSWIFLIYAGLMFAIMIVFMFIAYRYKYVLYVRNK